MLVSMEPRTGRERQEDALQRLQLQHAHAWVASASADGVAHLVPLSYAWDGRRITLATRPRNPTALNIVAKRRARMALGHTQDVVMIDAELDAVLPLQDAPGLAEAYAAQCDWDPRDSVGDWVFITLRPVAIQAWREENELAGRDIMRGGAWLL